MQFLDSFSSADACVDTASAKQMLDGCTSSSGQLTADDLKIESLFPV
tara:strand:- start:513 stop:653 length:141 start_codon:yes stop_codon:yes gene_type:complete